MSALALFAGCASTPETSDTGGAVEVAELITFQSEYGFTLDFPKSWEGYSAEEKEADFGFTVTVIYFYTPEGADLFALSVFTPEQWDTVQAQEGPKPVFLGETDTYVFGWDNPQDSAGLETYLPDFEAVKASFKAL